jgi:erythromycin esterase-like protein
MFGERDVYGYYAGTGLVSPCDRQAVDVVRDLQHHRERLIRASSAEAYFNALMAALEVQNGERFHRASYFGGESAWNIRDIHMQDMLDALLDHYVGSKAVVWEHNTHVGDFRQTGNAGGQINIGQLTRQRHPGDMVSVGFGHYEGSVTASRYWGAPRIYARTAGHPWQLRQRLPPDRLASFPPALAPTARVSAGRTFG